MKIFLASYFLIYGAMHVYFYVRLKGAYALTTGLNLGLIFFLTLMVLAPILVRLSEQKGWETVAIILSYGGYTWMGIIFLFVSLALTLDIVRLVLYFTPLKLAPRLIFLLPLVLALGAYLYGYGEAKRLRIEHLTITSPKIPATLGNLRLVQVSDIHIGLIVRGKRLARMVETLQATHPDILVSTGDLVDGQIDNLESAVTLWQQVQPRYGKFAVTGNHEFFAGIDQALAFTHDCGFRVLRGEAVSPLRGVRILGIDDPMGRYLGRAVKDTIPSGGAEFTILLTHQPLGGAHVGPCDLRLAGHTHGGQIFPFSLITELYFHHRQAGLFHLGDWFAFIREPRYGTWGPPIRLFAPRR